MQKDNLWILTEESINIVEIEKIIKETNNKCNLSISISQLKITPEIQGNYFKHRYLIEGFHSKTIEKVYIKSIQPASQNPFVDFLVFLQEDEPDPNEKFKNCIFAIEATKTNTYDSRNTALGQRASKFVHLNFYLETMKYPTTNVMYKTHPQAPKDHDSVVFIGKLLNHLPNKTEFWGSQTKTYMKFNTIEELITEKNKISAKNTRDNDTPIFVKYNKKDIRISGRLSKPGSSGGASARYTGKIGHDPNQGQLAIIAKSLRTLGHKDKIIICDHDLLPSEVKNAKNKFIKFADYIGFEIENCIVKKVDFNKNYFKYLIRSKEKIASILAQVILVNKGMKTIFENHGGCEKSFIDTNVFEDFRSKTQERYIVFPKDYSNISRKIPDLIMADQQKKIIYLYEGKKSTTKQAGVKEILQYEDLEKHILTKHYPKFTFERRLIIEGGEKDPDSIVSFQLDKNSNIYKKNEFL
jgi:hypothetical protein